MSYVTQEGITYDTDSGLSRSETTRTPRSAWRFLDRHSPQPVDLRTLARTLLFLLLSCPVAYYLGPQVPLSLPAPLSCGSLPMARPATSPSSNPSSRLIVSCYFLSQTFIASLLLSADCVHANSRSTQSVVKCSCFEILVDA